MKRVDWTERLADTIKAHRRLPFRWGGRGTSQDCCTFAAACIDAMTGSRRLDALLANYHDERTALAYIKACGGLAAAIGTHLGKTKAVAQLRTGDVVVWKRKRMEFAGMVVSDKIVSTGAGGLVVKSLKRAVAGWSV